MSDRDLDWGKLQPPKFFTEEYFEEKYGTEVTLTVTAVQEEKVGKDEEVKGVMHFAEDKAGFVVNVTNRKYMQEKAGKGSSGWRGARVTLTLKREGIRITLVVPASQVDATVPF
jgi:hypothetical protein